MALQIGCFGVMFFLVGCALYTLCNRKYRKYFVLCKMLCSTTFLGTALIMAGTYGKWREFLQLLPALLFCYLGDLLLGVHNKSRKSSFFLGGTASFGIAHGCFFIVLFGQQPLQGLDMVAVVLIPLFIWLLGRSKSFHFGRYQYMAMGYGALVAGFSWKCILNAVALPNTANMLMAIGGVLFFVSDSIIFLTSFWKKKVWAFHGINFVTYYMAMYVITITIAYR